MLRQRLDLLDDNQQQQLDEFHEVAHSTLRNTITVVEKDVDSCQEKIDIEKATAFSPEQST